MPVIFDDYLRAIKEHLPIAKKGSRSRFLQVTTMGSLKKSFIFLLEKGKLTSRDQFNLRYFLKVKEDDDLIRSINKSEDKFKPIKHFIDGKTENPSQDVLEMVAILTNFNPRPYNNFNHADGVVIYEDEVDQVDDIGEADEEVDPKPEVKSSEKGYTTDGLKDDGPITDDGTSHKQSIPVNRKIARIGILLVFCIVIGVFGIKAKFFKDKECMQWKGNHYELVNCQTEQLGIANTEGIKPYDAVEFKRRKINVCEETPFFKNHKPIVWYSKQDNVVEFFNMDGYHPETGTELNQITDYMIDKYVEPCK